MGFLWGWLVREVAVQGASPAGPTQRTSSAPPVSPLLVVSFPPGLCGCLEAVGEGGVAAAGASGADGGGQGAAGSGQHDEFPGPGDAGVEQVALEHHPRAGDQRDDHGGVPDMAIALIRAIIAAADKDRDEMTVLLIRGEPAAVIAPLRA